MPSFNISAIKLVAKFNYNFYKTDSLSVEPCWSNSKESHNRSYWKDRVVFFQINFWDVGSHHKIHTAESYIAVILYDKGS